MSVTMSGQLAEALEAAETGVLVDRMEAIRSREGNPEGIEIEQFGGCTAVYSRTMGWTSFNAVCGIGPEDTGAVRSIVDYYRERNRKFEVRIIPGKLNAELAKELAAYGLMQTGFHSALYAETAEVHAVAALSGPEQDDSEVTFREMNGDEFDIYGRIHCLGFGLPADGAAPIAANNRVLFGREGWRFFLGFAGGVPAAAGVMRVQEDIASFTLAATLPDYRGRGLHAGLLRKRIETAASCGARFVAAQASFGSGSCRNMERAGLKLAYLRAIWTMG